VSPETLTCLANSVHWYESVFRSHGLSWARARGLWSSAGRAPPYHSNVLTLTPEGGEDQIVAIEALGASLGCPFTVKDSFACLDLAALGFEPLFDAEWIWRQPRSACPPPLGAPGAWRRVDSASELERWEFAWREHGSPASAPVFLPELLADASIAVFAASRDGRIVAGCVANRSDGAVGLSNAFSADGDVQALLARAAAQVGRFAPELPLVGYEAGEALEAARRLGFRSAGPLRVWAR
jgi:hypothetical protein